jgi:uncharacterized protein involved in exopolysaccharide biosynthesis
MSEPLRDPRGLIEEDEIDLQEIWRVLVENKRMILSSIFVSALLAAGITLLLPNIYRAEVLLAPVKVDDTTNGGGVAAALSGLGGLASLAGISLGSGGSTDENLAVLKSREFLWKFVQDNKLMPILFEDDWDAAQKKWKDHDPKDQPGQMDLFRLLDEDVLNVSTDKKTGLVTVSIDWTDPVLAASWADQLVSQLNQHIRLKAVSRSENNLKYLNEELARTQVEEMRKTLFDLIGQEQKNAMLANAQREFAFRVLDPAVVPDKKIKPKRTIIVLLAAVLVGFFAILIAFIRNSRKAQMVSSVVS